MYIVFLFMIFPTAYPMQVLGGQPMLETITKHKPRSFVISSDYPKPPGENLLEIDGAWLREGNHDRKNYSGFEGKAVSFSNRDNLSSKKFHKTKQRHMIST